LRLYTKVGAAVAAAAAAAEEAADGGGSEPAGKRLRKSMSMPVQDTARKAVRQRGRDTSMTLRTTITTPSLLLAT